MCKWIYASITCLIISVANTAYANTSDTNLAKGVIENWFAAMANKNYTQAASYLAPQLMSRWHFAKQVTRTDGHQTFKYNSRVE